MVYATVGRTAVYPIQKVLRLLEQEHFSINDELADAKAILKTLPTHHSFNEYIDGDHLAMRNIVIYDLLLHKRDVSYSVPELYTFLRRGGYNVVDFSLPENRIAFSLRCKIEENVLFYKLMQLKVQIQQAIGEIISSNIIKQDIYVSKQDQSEAKLDTYETNVVYAYGSPIGYGQLIDDARTTSRLRNKACSFAIIARSRIDEASLDHISFVQENTQTFQWGWPSTHSTTFNNFILRTLTKKPIKPKSLYSIIKEFNKKFKYNMTIDMGATMFEDLFLYIKQTGMFLVKNKSVPSFPLTSSLNMFRVFSSTALRH